MGSDDLDRALLRPIITQDTGVKRVADRSKLELDKKLEDTLSGVRLRPRPQAAPKQPSPEPGLTAPVAAPRPPEPAPLPKVEAPPAPAIKAEEAPSASHPEEAPAKEGGATFGQYILMDKIAVGGMAELFKAKQTGLEGFQRIVAIKRILPHLAANSDFVTMFIDEAKLAAQLSHPNIAHIYDLGRLEDAYFIAMEYVEGKDLRAILRALDEEGKLFPTRAAVFVAQQVASALHYAHVAKDSDRKPMHLVHRDVSPQNILISSVGEVKLVDFGIAKAASKASHTQSGALKGKLLYMSPEQAFGRPTDARTDIFSLAIVLFEMLTGRKLFYGDSEMSILEKVREAKLPDFAEYRASIPEGLEKILRRALEKDLSRRYPDCKALQLDLERFARQEWKALPGPYHAVEFLTGIFPDVYKKDALQLLAREHADSKLEDTADRQAEPQAQPQAAPAPEGASKTETKQSKFQRGKPAPFKKQAPSQEEKPQPKPQAPAPKPQQPSPAAEKPPQKDEPKQAPVPQAAEESAGMFKSMREEQSSDKKKLYLIGGIAAAVVVLVIVIFAVMGSKKPSAPLPAAPSASTAPAQPQPAPAAPPVLEPPKPAAPAAGTAPATEAEIKAAREQANGAVKSFDEAISAAEQAGAAQYATAALDSLKQSKANIDKLYRRAKTVEEYNAASQTAKQGLTLAQQVKDQAAQAKTADEQMKATEAAAATEATRKAAEEEARKKAEAEKAAQAAAAQTTKPGDFVEIFAVNVKPRELTPLKVEYTPQARTNRLQGTIYIEADINERGEVTAARVVKAPNPDYGMGDTLSKAALGMKFSPAIKDNVPVKTKLTFPVQLKIK